MNQYKEFSDEIVKELVSNRKWLLRIVAALVLAVAFFGNRWIGGMQAYLGLLIATVAIALSWILADIGTATWMVVALLEKQEKRAG